MKTILTQIFAVLLSGYWHISICTCIRRNITGGTFQKNKYMDTNVILAYDKMGPKICVADCMQVKNCNAVNFRRDLLRCELLSVSYPKDKISYRDGSYYTDMINWTRDPDACWPQKPCKGGTKCVLVQNSKHVCISFVYFWGSISSPGYPNNYNNSQVRTYTLSVTNGYTVVLKFVHFHTEVNHDYVRIYDGLSTSDALLTTRSGNSLGEDVESSGNNMYVEWRTDGSVVYTGWKANYFRKG